MVVGDGPGTSYATVLAAARSTPLPAVDPDALCGLHYSSGTTGHPKGARRTHRNWLREPGQHDRRRPRRAAAAGRRVRCTPGRSPIPAGCSCCRSWRPARPSWCCRRGTRRAFVDAVEHRGVTHTALVPTMVARLLAMPDVDRSRMRGLRMLGYAGAPMPPEQMRQAYDRITPNLVQYYGLVEAIPPVTVLTPPTTRGAWPTSRTCSTSAGRPALGVELAVVDEDGRARAARRGRRGRHPRRPRHARVLERGRPRGPGQEPCGTAGCTPATSVASTPTAGSGWSTARAT